MRNIPIINADILLICLFTFSNCLFTFTQHLFTSSLLFIYLRFSFIYLHSASPVYIFVPACLHFPLTLFIFSAYAQNIERKTTPSCTPSCTKNYKAFWDNELNAGQPSSLAIIAQLSTELQKSHGESFQTKSLPPLKRSINFCKPTFPATAFRATALSLVNIKKKKRKGENKPVDRGYLSTIKESKVTLE